MYYETQYTLIEQNFSTGRKLNTTRITTIYSLASFLIFTERFCLDQPLKVSWSTFLTRHEWMPGTTPPPGMITFTPSNNGLSSSSIATAIMTCLGLIVFFFMSLAQFPASSKTSAMRYSSTAPMYTTLSGLILLPILAPYILFLRA